MNERLINSEWLLYGEAGLPGWGAALLLAVVLYASWRWLKYERGNKRGLAATLLPCSLAGFWIMVALLAWQPAIIHISTWEKPGSALAWLDPSASMDTPLGGASATAQLDALTFWKKDACAGRATAARDIAQQLANLPKNAEIHLHALEARQQEAEQGLPIGEKGREALAAYEAWAKELRSALTQGAAASLEAGAKIANPPATIKDNIAIIQDFSHLIDKLPTSAGQGDAAQARLAANALHALLAQASQAAASLAFVQDTLDRNYMEQEKARLEPLMKEHGSKSRRDAAKQMMSALPASLKLEQDTGGRREETDISGAIDRMLNTHEGQPVSHILILSDGGDNCLGGKDEAGRLRQAGIKLVTVGIGQEGMPIRDFAIRDWQCPRFARAEQLVTLKALIKTPQEEAAQFKLTLSEGSTALQAITVTTNGQDSERASIAFKAPPAGRHYLSLRVEGGDSNPANDEIRFTFDSMPKLPDALMLGDYPDWDTAYLSLAAGRIKLNLKQVFSGALAPSRGSGAGAVPNSKALWAAQKVVVLRGKAFKGFAASDADDLFSFITEAGGTLIILAPGGGKESYLAALAGKFGWQEEPHQLDQGALLVSPEAEDLPFLRLGVGGANSARSLSLLGTAGQLCQVPTQQWTIAQAPGKQPTFTLGTYGRGRVFILGAQGLHRLREYENAALLDRLLEQWLGDAACPLSTDKTATTLVYPALIEPGKKLLASQPGAAGSSGQATAAGAKESPLQKVPGGKAALMAAPVNAKLALGDTALSLPLFHNPGQEEVDFEFNNRFLRELATSAQGQHLQLENAAKELSSLQAKTWQERTANAYRPASHWIFLILLLACGALHWVLRKLAGIAV